MSSSLKQVLLGGAIWAGAGKLISMVCNFVLTIVLTHGISPAAYGGYHVVTTTIIILATVGTLGMDQVVVRFASMCQAIGDRVALGVIVATCVKAVVAGSLVTALLFFYVAPWFMGDVLQMPDLINYLWIIVVWLVLATVQRQLAETWRGLNDIRFATIFGGIRNVGMLTAVTTCIGMVALWAMGMLTLRSALWVMLSTSALTVLAAALVMRARFPQMTTPATNVGVEWSGQRALSEAWPLWLAVMITVLSSLGSTWLASAFDTPEHVALFGVAQKFTLLLVAPLVVINAILPPVIAQLHATGELVRLQHVVQAVAGITLLPCLFLLLFLVVAGRPLLDLLFGDYYVASFPMLLLICLGQVANIATGSWQIVLPMTGSRYQVLYASGISLFVQLVMGIWLGMVWGVWGVAVGYCTSIVIANVVGMLIVKNSVGIWTYAVINRATIELGRNMITSRIKRSTSPRIA